ncbi:MAG: hypothetical protein MHM6MM_000683 [Cercozoa sp. M6MM]
MRVLAAGTARGVRMNERSPRQRRPRVISRQGQEDAPPLKSRRLMPSSTLEESLQDVTTSSAATTSSYSPSPSLMQDEPAAQKESSHASEETATATTTTTTTTAKTSSTDSEFYTASHLSAHIVANLQSPIASIARRLPHDTARSAVSSQSVTPRRRKSEELDVKDMARRTLRGLHIDTAAESTAESLSAPATSHLASSSPFSEERETAAAAETTVPVSPVIPAASDSGVMFSPALWREDSAGQVTPPTPPLPAPVLPPTPPLHPVVTPQEAPSQEAPSQGTLSQGTVSQETVSQEVPSQETPSQETLPREASPQATQESGTVAASTVSRQRRQLRVRDMTLDQRLEHVLTHPHFRIDTEEDIDAFLFMRTVPQLVSRRSPLIQRPRSSALPPHLRQMRRLRADDMRKNTLVLDLDETLVHCAIEPIPNPDARFPVDFGGMRYTVYARRRPGFAEFLEQVSQWFEIVIFTASQRVYADRLLDTFDPDRRWTQNRIFRDACVMVSGNFLKDLSVLQRDLSRVAIVDNSPTAFAFQVDNGMPIESWFDDESDRELLAMLPFLRRLSEADDVRPLIQQRYGLRRFLGAMPPSRVLREEFTRRVSGSSSGSTNANTRNNNNTSNNDM